MHKQLLIISFVLSIAPLLSGAKTNEWLTDYEKSNYLETPHYAQTVAFCQKLADYSPMARFTDFGVSPQGRKLPLLIIDKDREFDPHGPKTADKAVLLFQAGIHAGEIEGKDAILTLARDILVDGKYAEMLDHVVILFIPIFSVDAHERFGPYNRINQNGPKEMGWRTTANNLNLNRDFVKADAQEMRFWLELFNHWKPDFLCDLHVTDGADYQYVITYGIEENSNVAKPLAEWTTNKFLPEIQKRMEQSGFPMPPYVIPKVGNDVTSGLMAFAGPPRLSNGYGAARNRPFLLIETHMLKPYKARVDATYQLMRHVIAYLNETVSVFKQTIVASDSVTANGMTGTYFPLSFRPTKDSTMVDFLGVDFHFEKSPISDTTRIVWGKKKVTYRVPYFGTNAPSDSALIPYAYLIPQEWQYEINLLQLHGAVIRYLSQDTNLSVASYRFSDPKWSQEPYEGRHLLKIKADTIVERRFYPAGTALVLMNQASNRIIAHLLEPKAPDSFVSWGFFDAIFEEKEYAENYVIEDLAPKMLADNPVLKKEFDRRVATDTAFAKSPTQRLNFFYERSPYYDQKIDVYPIGKLMTRLRLPIR